MVTAQQHKHVNGVQNIVSGEVRDVHVTRMRFYSDSELDITSDLSEIFSIHFFDQGDIEMEALINIGESHDSFGFLVRVRWSGFEEDEDTREPQKTVGGRAAICEAATAKDEIGAQSLQKTQQRLRHSND